MKGGGFSLSTCSASSCLACRLLWRNSSSVNAPGKVYLVALRWLVPIAIILIFLNSLGVL